jgi:dolichyl-phosphate beta-glucosyltransferase
MTAIPSLHQRTREIVDGIARPVVSLIVPVYNGGPSIRRTLMTLTDFLAAQSFTSELIVVDDSSDDDTPAVIDDVRGDSDHVRVIRNEKNRGKGFSVARGMLASRGLYRIFTDADLAYPAEEVNKIVADLDAGADVAIACRVLPESRYLMSPSFFSYLYTRHVMSRVFNAAVRWTLVPGVLDTQAGLKGFTAAAAETVFSRLTISRFGFDVEALHIARVHGLRVKQTAVYFRYDSEPTTVRFAHDAIDMAVDIARIRLNDLRGRYS